MVNQAANALGSNAITNALGIDFGTILTPSKFLTKFTPSTVFAYRSLAYEIRNSKNFDVIFHWFPRCSQIRSMFSNAFSAADTNEINLLVRSIRMPSLITNPTRGNNDNPKFSAAFPGLGVNGNGNLSMTFLNTEFSYVNHCFYQWLSETESPFWIYGPSVTASTSALDNLKELGKLIFPQDKVSKSTAIRWMSYEDASKLIYLNSQSETAPFTRADIEIKMYSGNMKELHSIWFMGAFPIMIELENMDHNPVGQNDLEGHVVTFTYDSICISSPFTYETDQTSYSDGTVGGVTKQKSNLTNAASSMFGKYSNSAAWTAGLYDDTLTQIANTYLAKASRKMNRVMNKTGAKVQDKLKTYQSKLTA